MRDKYIVYTMPSCPDCKNAKQFLESRGCEFDEVTEFTPAELRELVGPVRSLPQIIFIRGNTNERYHVGGYKDLTSFMTDGEPFDLARRID